MSVLLNNETKIWFTMGPASSEPNIVSQLIQHGAGGCRLTFSYGTPEIQIKRADLIREKSRQHNAKCDIIADLAGEKIRLGEFNGLNQLMISKGDKLKFAKSGFDLSKKIIPVNSTEFIDRVSKGDHIVIGDGSAELIIIEKFDNSLTCEAVDDGVLNPNRGIVAQSDSVQPSSLTMKDWSDLKAIINSQKFDAVAFSFISKHEELKQIHDFLNDNSAKIPIIAKIETKKGVENLPEILPLVDAIIIGRGDLALFSPWTELGFLVDQAAKTAKKANKPWVIGTQLVEGLERFSFPTRSEICDITRWLTDGASGFLLSYETAFGPKAVSAVSSLNKLITAYYNKFGERKK